MPMPAGTLKIAAAHHVLHLNTCSAGRRQSLLQSESTGTNRKLILISVQTILPPARTLGATTKEA